MHLFLDQSLDDFEWQRCNGTGDMAKMYVIVRVKYSYLWVEINENRGAFLECKFRDRYAYL
jgi:hypothetical protein